MPRSLISIVLCTYNRAPILEVALRWLADIDRPSSSDIELVVVDNNSTDETQAVVESFREQVEFPVAYVLEAKQGVAAARNAGVRAASGDVLAFTDDDCFPVGSWLQEIERAFSSQPILAGGGGRVELYDERDLPLTIRTSMERQVATVGSLFSLVPGCNMFFRRSAIDELGFFDERFGAGTQLGSAEDSDFIYRALSAALRVEYIPEICVFHAHGRQTAEEERRLVRGYVVGRGAFYCKHILGGDKEIVRHAYWEFRSLLLGLFRQSGRAGSLRAVGYLLKGMLLYLPVHGRRAGPSEIAGS